MDRYSYYDIDPSNRIYSEEELQHIQERYLLKPAETDGGSRSSGQRRLGSAWKALLSLLSNKQLSGRGG
jgi:hypothetical protein